MKAMFWTACFLTLWLALAPARVSAAPPPPPGRQVYTDDFSDPKKSGLEDNRNATDFERGFHDPGVYHLKLLRNHDTRWVVFPNQSYGDFTMEVELQDYSDEFTGDVSSGVIFRVKDAAHLYAVLLDPRSGRYAIRKLNGKDNWTDLVVWKASPLVKHQAERNRLRVDAMGDKATVYLNDEMLDSTSDGAYTQGGIGFIVNNVDAAQPHMHFDNVAVYTAEAPSRPAQPKSLPNTGQTAALAPLVLAACALVLLSLGAFVRRRARTY
jgi:LPXTG-motif cell wall-anchored protein